MHRFFYDKNGLEFTMILTKCPQKQDHCCFSKSYNFHLWLGYFEEKTSKYLHKNIYISVQD